MDVPRDRDTGLHRAMHVRGLRRSEVERVTTTITSGSRLVSIVGLGGIGKSALARDVIDELRQQHPEFVCSAFPVGPATGDSIREQLLDELGSDLLDRSSRLGGAEPARLIVLDGGEQLVEHAQTLEEVLDSVPGLHLLVTSRVPLKTPSEAVFRLRGLSTALGGDAVRMFVALAEEQSIVLTTLDRHRVHAIVGRLGGHPLAIRMCTTQLATRSLDEIHAHVVHNDSTVTAHSPMFRAVIRWSLDRQSTAAVELLHLLAVFHGWGTLESIESVAAEVRRRACPVRHDAGQALWLAELVDAGLVDTKSASALGDDVRLFRVPDPVRDVLRDEGLSGDIPQEILVTAHRDWFFRRAGELATASTTRSELSAYAELQAELAEFLAAMDSMIEVTPLAVLQVANAAGTFWQTRGRMATGAQLLRRSLVALGEDPDALGHTSLDIALGQSLLHAMRVQEGAPVNLVEYKDWLWARLGELLIGDHQVGEGQVDRAHFALGMHFHFAAVVSEDHARAIRLLTRLLELAVATGDDYYAAQFHNALGRLQELAGSPVLAQEHLTRAIVHARRTQNEVLVASCMAGALILRRAELTSSEFAMSLRPLPEVHLRHRTYRDAVHMSIPLALAHHEAGDTVESVTLMRRMLALSRRVHYFDGQLHFVALIAFADLTPTSTPEHAERAARLYGGLQPYQRRLLAVTPPPYRYVHRHGLDMLRQTLGAPLLERIASQASMSWPDVLDEAEELAAILQEEAGSAPGLDPAHADLERRITIAARKLNNREREVLDLVLTGIGDKQIAERLGLTHNTVRSYNSRIFRKFGTSSRTELLAMYRSRAL